jgi:single-stranded DNA-binding protein
MLNQFIIVGRIVKDLEKESNVITIAIPRHYKNENGEYETDFVDVGIDGTLAKTTIEYCKKGDIIGVKGNIRSEISNDIRKMLLVAERVTFLSSKKADE